MLSVKDHTLIWSPSKSQVNFSQCTRTIGLEMFALVMTCSLRVLAKADVGCESHSEGLMHQDLPGLERERERERERESGAADV